jgi:hypothetical protein
VGRASKQSYGFDFYGVPKGEKRNSCYCGSLHTRNNFSLYDHPGHEKSSHRPP